jgi:hypothetical protein
MEAVYRVEIDGFTTAPGLNETIVGLERVMSLLGQLDKQKDILNKATTTKGAAGAVTEIEKTTDAITREKIALSQLEEQQAKTATAGLQLQKAKRQEQAAIEKANQKTREQSGLLGKLRSDIQRLNSLKWQAGTPAQIERINRLIDVQKQKLSQLQNVGKQTTNTFGNALGSFQFKFNFLGNLFASVTTGLSDSIVSFGTSSVKAFVEAEKNAKQLQLALKGNAVAAGDLIKQSGELQDKGIFSDDDIQRAQTQLANFGATSTQIKELTPLITDLAAATGKDLGEATDLVVKGINGQTRGLKMLGIDYKDTGNKAENLAILTDKLTKFQGANAAQLETVIGKTKRLENAFDDFQETVGEYLVNEGARTLDYFELFAAALTGNGEGALTFALRRATDNLQEYEQSQFDAFLKDADKIEDVGHKKMAAITEEGRLRRQLTAFIQQQTQVEGKVNAQRLINIASTERSLASIVAYRNSLNEVSTLGDDPDEADKKAKAAEDLAKRRLDAQNDLRKLEAEAIKDQRLREFALQQVSTEAEIRQLKEKHEQGILSQSDFEKSILFVMAKSNEERIALRKKFNDEEAKGYEELFAVLDAELERRAKLEQDFATAQHELTLDTIDANIVLMEEGADKEIAEIEAQSQRKIEALEAEQEKQIELAKEAGKNELEIKQQYDDLILLTEADTAKKAEAVREKFAKEAADKQREDFNKRVEDVESFISSVADAYEKAQEKRIGQLEEQGKEQESVVDEQRARAIAGQSNSLAAEESRQAAIEQAQAAQQRKLEKIKKLEAFFNLFAEFAKQDPENAVPKTLAKIGEATVASLLFAEKGGIVGDVKDRTQLTASGLTKSHGTGNDIVVVASPNEGILTESEVKTLGGRAGFYDLKRMLAAGDNPIDSGAFGRQSEAFASTYLRPVVQVDQNREVVNKIEELITVTKNPPIDTVLVDSIGNLLHYVKKNNQTTITRKSNIRKGWID